MPPPPPSPLMDEIVEEILLLLPPGDPGPLFRASLVCKPWRSLLTSSSFRRRYREFHRVPPLLGYFGNSYGGGNSRFFSTSSFRPPAPDQLNRCVLDSRHGRVLFENSGEFVVWDPIADVQWRVPLPESASIDLIHLNAAVAVLCARTADGCDHIDCHAGPFLVALMYTHQQRITSACLYSSQAGAWSDVTSLESQFTLVFRWPSVLVGSTIYFTCKFSSSTLRYNLVSRELSVIQRPFSFNRHGVLITAEDGALGFAWLHESIINLLSREIDVHGDVGWVKRRVIKLETLLPTSAFSNTTKVIGFAEGVGLIFLRTNVGAFTIELKSGSVSKLSTSGYHDFIFPCMSFCTPGHARGIMPPP